MGKSFISIKFRSMFVAASLSMLVEYSMALTDKVIVGHLLDKAALPALTLAEPLTLVLAFVACVLGAGAGIQVSAALGKGRQEEAERQFSQALILALGTGLALSLLYFAFGRRIVDSLAGGLPEYEYVWDYFRCARLLPAPMLLNAVAYPIVLYRGGEKYCNYSAIISIFGNIGLSILLVFRIGMAGVSLGTVIGSWAGLMPLIAFLFTPRGRMRLCWHFSFRDIRSMSVSSIGNSIIYLYMAIFQACMNTFLLHRFDSTAIVVFTGVVNLAGLFAAMSDGIGEFLLPMINMYRGEKNVIGEKKTILTALRASIAEGLVFTALVLAFAGFMPSLFGVEDASVRGDFAVAARIYALSACFFYVLNMFVRYYLYIGRTKTSLALSMCLNLLFQLVLGIAGGLIGGMVGVWIGISAAMPLLLLCAWYVIGRQRGADRLCLFLDRERMARQKMWDVPMTIDGVAALMDAAERHMLDNGVSRDRINRVLLMIEETQMDDLGNNKASEKLRIECTLFLEESITLILRNTGVNRNIIADGKTKSAASPSEEMARFRILSSMRDVSYILVNGSNRLIGRFD